MTGDLIILASARKRGYADGDLLHVVAWPLVRFDQGDGMVMRVGHDRSGRLMEVGTITLSDGATAIAHALRPPSQRISEALAEHLGQSKTRGRRTR